MIKGEFDPNLTPNQILLSGAFGGSYFGIEDLKGDYDYQSLFQNLLSDVPPHLYLGEKYKPRLNKFRIRSGMDYKYWTDMGWIHQDDPYGWFEWYLKYYNGRRHTDDERQISRWQQFCGVNGRWRNRIYSRINETGDWNASPRIQQSLLHWGYQVNEHDYQTWLDLRGL